MAELVRGAREARSLILYPARHPATGHPATGRPAGLWGRAPPAGEDMVARGGTNHCHMSSARPLTPCPEARYAMGLDPDQ